MNQDTHDAERQRLEEEQQSWEEHEQMMNRHFKSVRSLEALLDEMGVKHIIVKERK